MNLENGDVKRKMQGETGNGFAQMFAIPLL